MRVSFKSFPLHNRALPEITRVWRPVLQVQIIHNHAPSKKFEALIDTGTDYCLFDAFIGASIGIKIDKGAEGDIGGIIAGVKSKVYFHNVKLAVGTEMVDIKAGFCWDITGNLLGQTGFFNNFAISFLPAFEPPCFDIERVRRH